MSNRDREQWECRDKRGGGGGRKGRGEEGAKGAEASTGFGDCWSNGKVC